MVIIPTYYSINENDSIITFGNDDFQISQIQKSNTQRLIGGRTLLQLISRFQVIKISKLESKSVEKAITLDMQ